MCKKVFLVILLLATSCTNFILNNIDITFTIETKQDNLHIIALRDTDTVAVLDSAGAVSFEVFTGEIITTYLYIKDITGELVLYSKREFEIKYQSVKYVI